MKECELHVPARVQKRPVAGEHRVQRVLLQEADLIVGEEVEDPLGDPLGPPARQVGDEDAGIEVTGLGRKLQLVDVMRQSLCKGRSEEVLDRKEGMPIEGLARKAPRDCRSRRRHCPSG